MVTTTLSSKNQIVIPAKIRQSIHLEPKQKLTVETKNNQIILTPAPTKLKDFRGIVTKAFQKLGGGKKFFKKERQAWND